MELFDSDDVRWTLVTTGSTVLAAFLVRRFMERSWKAATGEEPPRNPEGDEVAWRDALLWAGATGAAVALGRVLARKGAATGWRKVTGRPAPIDRRG